jgi:PKD repeat protein
MLAVGVFATTAMAQFNIVLPNGAAVTEGSSSNAFPWGRGATGMLHQCVYDSSHFTAQGITYPIMINGLRWRPNTGVALVATTFPIACSIRLSTCPVDWTLTTTTFATNRGPDETLCFQGPVSFPAQPAVVGPTPFGINIPLTTPFLYNPNLGDLNIECDLPIQTGYVGGTPQLDVSAAVGVANAARIYWSTGYTGYPGGVATARDANHAVVVQVDYVPAAGLFAGFSANVTGGPSPLAVNFTSGSYSSDPGGITSYAWDFDGDSVIDSTAQNPSFVYAACGDYTVSLTVTDASHPPSTLTRTAYIRTDRIAADFTYQILPGPYVVQFTDTSNMAATSWDWDLNGDGITDSTAQNPAFVYPNANPVNVTLKVTRLCSPISTIIKSVVPVQQLTTNLAVNNGVGTPATLYFNLNVTNPLGIRISSFDTITQTISTPFTADVYLKMGTYQGSELNPAPWTQVGTASGTTPAVANTPANSSFPIPLYIPFGSYGVAIRYVGAYPRYVTQAALTTWSNGDLSLTAGAASLSTLGAFTGTNLNSPRSWAGTLYYGTNNVTSLAGYGWFGPGCPGSVGQSHLVNTTQPQLGGTLSVNVSNMQFAVGLMIIGLSNTISGFGPLPVDLTGLGMPGCPLRVSLDATDAVIGVGTSATWNFPIPNSAPLVGMLLYNQCANFDTINTFGMVVSDASGWVLGN